MTYTSKLFKTIVLNIAKFATRPMLFGAKNIVSWLFPQNSLIKWQLQNIISALVLSKELCASGEGFF